MNLWNRPPTIPTGNNLKHHDVGLGENKTLLYSGGYCKQSTQMGNLIEWEQRQPLDFRQGTNINNLQRIIEIKY